MAENRKRSRLSRNMAGWAGRCWALRGHLLIGAGYLVLFAWLFEGGVTSVPPDSLSFSDVSGWEPAPGESWFGRKWMGHDLLALSRIGMFYSAALALAGTALGVGAALIAGATINGRRSPESLGHLLEWFDIARVLPVLVIVIIVMAGSGGDTLVLLGTVSVIAALISFGPVCRWFHEVGSGPDVTAALAVGLSRSFLNRRRFLPLVAHRCVALVCELFPRIILIEMAVSFIGFIDGRRISCGALIGVGRDFMMEAPWLTVWPGVIAALALLLLGFLGRCVRLLARVDRLPCSP